MVTPVTLSLAAGAAPAPSPAVSRPAAGLATPGFSPAASVSLSPGASQPPAPVQAGAAPAQPLALSVDRADNGVFVYTLREPNTGAVIAVIPREQVQANRSGRLDQKV